LPSDGVTVGRKQSMKIDSLEELESAFARWRRTKKHAREPVPDELLARARRATKKHGVTAVVRVTRVERARLFRSVPAGRAGRGETSKKARRGKAASRSAPAFSRLELGAPAEPGVRPLVEVETATGVKLRVFEQTPQMLSLLSAACGFGGDR
jgi:hypothetical protein